MPDDSSREQKPVAAVEQAVIGGAIGYLRLHPILRSIFGGAGALLFILGVIAAPLWNVPIFAWLYGNQIAATGLIGGLGALGIWYLSGPGVGSPSAGVIIQSNPSTDLVNQLERLRDLHVSGGITDEEFRQAKTKLLS